MILVDGLGMLSGVLSSHKFTRVTSPIEQMSIYLPLAIHIKWYKVLGLILKCCKMVISATILFQNIPLLHFFNASFVTIENS